MNRHFSKFKKVDARLYQEVRMPQYQRTKYQNQRKHSYFNIVLTLGFEDSLEALAATDVNILMELSNTKDRVTILNGSVNDVDSRVTELDATLTVLEETVSEIDGRVSQLELSGIFLCAYH